jgi:hypothetical protein
MKKSAKSMVVIATASMVVAVGISLWPTNNRIVSTNPLGGVAVSSSVSQSVSTQASSASSLPEQGVAPVPSDAIDLTGKKGKAVRPAAPEQPKTLGPTPNDAMEAEANQIVASSGTVPASQVEAEAKAPKRSIDRTAAADQGKPQDVAAAKADIARLLSMDLSAQALPVQSEREGRKGEIDQRIASRSGIWSDTDDSAKRQLTDENESFRANLANPNNVGWSIGAVVPDSWLQVTVSGDTVNARLLAHRVLTMNPGSGLISGNVETDPAEIYAVRLTRSRGVWKLAEVVHLDYIG